MLRYPDLIKPCLNLFRERDAGQDTTTMVDQVGKEVVQGDLYLQAVSEREEAGELEGRLVEVLRDEGDWMLIVDARLQVSGRKK